jgi:hypothetical protein
VCNSFLLRRFKTLDIFKLDMGLAIRNNEMINTEKYKSTAPSGINIKDEFVKKYLLLTDHQIYKYGTIGTLNFYEDLLLGHRDIVVFKDNDLFEIKMEETELQLNIKIYLTNLLKMLEEHEIQKKDLMINGNVITEEDIAKFDHGIPRPRIDLPKEQYIEAMIERRKKLSETYD